MLTHGRVCRARVVVPGNSTARRGRRQLEMGVVLRAHECPVSRPGGAGSHFQSLADGWGGEQVGPRKDTGWAVLVLRSAGLTSDHGEPACLYAGRDLNSRDQVNRARLRRAHPCDPHVMTSRDRHSDGNSRRRRGCSQGGDPRTPNRGRQNADGGSAESFVIGGTQDPNPEMSLFTSWDIPENIPEKDILEENIPEENIPEKDIPEENFPEENILEDVKMPRHRRAPGGPPRRPHQPHLPCRGYVHTCVHTSQRRPAAQLVFVRRPVWARGRCWTRRTWVWSRWLHTWERVTF